MEDGASHDLAAVETAPPPHSPPPPPDPNLDDATAATDQSPSTVKSDEPLRLDSEQWDIDSISALAALGMLIDALTTLAEATGDVPPTPPVSRPTTPRRIAEPAPRSPSRPQRPPSRAGEVPPVNIGSPEAHPHEPLTVTHDPHAEDFGLQHAVLARRFFSKVAPPFTLDTYLRRLHQFCPHSPAVYLAAAAYTHQLCVAGLMVPATSRTVHRLAVAAIRVAAKTLEDNKWAQERVAKVGGVSLTQLLNLEITLCFLLDFELWVDAVGLARRMFLLQEAARRGHGPKGRLAEGFKLQLPARKKKVAL